MQIYTIPIGSKVVPVCGLNLGSYKVTPKRNYFGAYGYGYMDPYGARFFAASVCFVQDSCFEDFRDTLV